MSIETFERDSNGKNPYSDTKNRCEGAQIDRGFCRRCNDAHLYHQNYHDLAEGYGWKPITMYEQLLKFARTAAAEKCFDKAQAIYDIAQKFGSNYSESEIPASHREKAQREFSKLFVND